MRDGAAAFVGGDAERAGECDDAVAVTQQSSYPKPLLGDGAVRVLEETSDEDVCLESDAQKGEEMVLPSSCARQR